MDQKHYELIIKVRRFLEYLKKTGKIQDYEFISDNYIMIMWLAEVDGEMRAVMEVREVNKRLAHLK